MNIKNQTYYQDENLIESRKLENKNILIDKKIFKDLMTYFTRCHLDKSITMLNLLYDKLIGTNKFIEYKEKKNN